MTYQKKKTTHSSIENIIRKTKLCVRTDIIVYYYYYYYKTFRCIKLLM